MPDIHHNLIISALPTKVYEAITSQAGLAAWWTPKSETSGAAGTIARFPFGDNYYKEMQVDELRPHELVRWTCLKGDSEWVSTTLSFRLESAEQQVLAKAHPEISGQLEQQTTTGVVTLLIFQHNNWKSYTPMFAECNYTWAQFLRSLKLLCETGKGRPWPDQHRL